MGKYSYGIIIGAIVMSVSLWLLGKTDISAFTTDYIRSLTQLTAIIGATGYLLSVALSSRLPLIEKLALPLDKAYKLHRILGTIAGAGILLHVTLLLVNVLPSPIALTLYLIPGKIISYNSGIVAFHLIVVLLISTLTLNLPYNVWRVVHRITGYSIVFAIIHIVLIPSDVAVNMPLRIWFFILMGIAAFSWVYKQFIYPFMSFRAKYVVSAIDRSEEVITITLRAVNKIITATPGQFAFFSFSAKSKKISHEAHPFTLFAVADDEITIAVKHLGDFTYRLQQLEVGDVAHIDGPYGGFGGAFINTSRPAVFIAGGIGVTPFYNLLTYAQQKGLQKPVTFFYTTKTEDVVFHPKVLSLASMLPLKYFYSVSGKQGRLTPEKVVATIGDAPQHFEYFLCGPKALLLSMVSYLQKIGVANEQIHVEDFDFRDLDV